MEINQRPELEILEEAREHLKRIINIHLRHSAAHWYKSTFKVVGLLDIVIERMKGEGKNE